MSSPRTSLVPLASLAALALAGVLGACAGTSPNGPEGPDAGGTGGGTGGGQGGGDAGPSTDGGVLDVDAGRVTLDLDGGLDAGAPNDPSGGTADGGTCSGQAGDHLRTLYFGGLLRTWYEHVPQSYDCAHPAPVVLNFHGYSSNALEEIALSKLNPKADAEGFIAIHPEGMGFVQSWNAGACCGEAAYTNANDLGFVRALVANLAQRYAIDPKRVYAMGMSNGGFFSHRLACEASDLIAAIAPVAGVMGLASCAPSRPMPIIDFHGTADTVVPYLGGGVSGFQPVGTTMSGWALRDGCGLTTSVVYQQGDATCRAWNGCPSGVDVQLCTIDGGGHTWPGGMPVPSLGKTSTDVSATDRAWSFFKAHPMP